MFSTHVHNTPSRPGLFLSDGPEFLERGEVFKQKFPRCSPSKKHFSAFFTKLLHRRSPDLNHDQDRVDAFSTYLVHDDQCIHKC